MAEESLDGFSEEIKGKSKRERVLKEQRKKSSRLSFGDESDGMIHGAGIGIRSSASAVKDAAATAAHWKTHEAEDDNAAVEGATPGRACRRKPCKKIHLYKGTLKAKEGTVKKTERKRS